LEERLERLNEPIESVKEEKKKIQGIGQLEERLAALRGVDVDIIRKPGLVGFFFNYFLKYFPNFEVFF